MFYDVLCPCAPAEQFIESETLNVRGTPDAADYWLHPCDCAPLAARVECPKCLEREDLFMLDFVDMEDQPHWATVAQVAHF